MGDVLPFHLARLSEARELLARRCAEQVLLDEAAQVACLSKFHFQRLFREAFGETPGQFQINQRLAKARTLLAVTDLSISEICLEIGYSSLGSFSAQFRRLAGCTPTEFRHARRSRFAIGWAQPRVLVPSCMVSHYAPTIAQFSRNAERDR
jgi:AraC-like DNA-binding protein